MDVYQEAQDVAKLLKGMGLEHESNALSNAIAAGSTGTEICMALHHELKRIIQEHDLPGHLHDQTSNLIRHLGALIS